MEFITGGSLRFRHNLVERDMPLVKGIVVARQFDGPAVKPREQRFFLNAFVFRPGGVHKLKFMRVRL